MRRGDPSLRFTALGEGSPFPRPGAACAGHLVRGGGAAVLLDAGGGTLANLQARVPLSGLDAIWITHLHADHLSDLPLAYYAWLLADPPLERIPLFGPPGLAARVEAFLESTTRHHLSTYFDVVELEERGVYEVRGLQLVARSVEHGVPAFAVRADASGASIAYSGDSGPCQALVELAPGADALVCEVGFAEAAQPAWHCTPEDAGTMAAEAGVGRLALTHLALDLDERAAVDRARRHFGGRVDVLHTDGEVEA